MEKLFMVAGESSGDLHGARLASALLRSNSALQIHGVGSAKMRDAGVNVLWDISSAAATGITEAVGTVPKALSLYVAVRRHLQDARPDAVILIDYPEFNLKLARFAKREGIRVVYYILPQVWAWRRYRIRTLKSATDLRIVIFPFEEEFYRRGGLDVKFVGHPLLEELEPYRDRAAARKRLGLRNELVIGLLPGSRMNEVGRHIGPMVDACRRLRAARPETRFLVACAPRISAEFVRSQDPLLEPVEGQTPWVMAASDVLVAASGTATLEAAIIGTPMVVIYKLSAASWLAARLLVSTPAVSMPNLILGEKAIPELLQHDVTGERIAREVDKLLDDGPDKARIPLGIVRERLGSPGAAERAAALILSLA